MLQLNLATQQSSKFNNNNDKMRQKQYEVNLTWLPSWHIKLQQKPLNEITKL